MIRSPCPQLVPFKPYRFGKQRRLYLNDLTNEYSLLPLEGGALNILMLPRPRNKTQQVRHIILIFKRNLLIILTPDIYYGYIFRQASGATEHGNLSHSTR